MAEEDNLKTTTSFIGVILGYSVFFLCSIRAVLIEASFGRFFFLFCFLEFHNKRETNRNLWKS